MRGIANKLTIGALASLLGLAGGWWGAVQHFGARVDHLDAAVSDLQSRQAALLNLNAAIAERVGVSHEYITAITPLAASSRSFAR